MIEATCSACGTLNRVSEANVPVGAKFITCADCKSRVAIPARTAPSGTAPKLPPSGPAAARSGAAVDLSDLPAPKRPSALGPLPSVRPGAAKPPPRPAPRSGLAAALDPELPAPKVTRSAGASPSALDFDDPPGGAAVDGGVDLPAPKRGVTRPQSLDPARDLIVDLPAPKIDRSVADLPAPKPNPRRASGGPPPSPLAPAARIPAGLADLPTPRRPSPIPSAISDLPAPRGPLIADLPAPRAHDAARSSAAELPAPKGFFDDLPQPAAADGDVELPAPKGFFDDLPQPALRRAAELPAPKGFFDDLPQAKAHPSGDSAELPAPKGFFDDLPQVKAHPAGDKPEVPAPKGYFDNIPALPSTSKPEAPAPKGYFDNIPALPSTSKPELPAPKGYFDNIPALPSTSKPEAPAPKGYFDNIPALPSTSKPELPAPKGYFDNIPALPSTSKPEAPAPKGHFENVPGRPRRKTDAPRGFFDDLPQPTGSHVAARHDGPPSLERDDGLELEPAQPHAPSSFGAPSSSRDASSFDDLDLSRPAASPVRFEPSRRAPTARPDAPPEARTADPVLELEDAPTGFSPRPSAPRPAKLRPASEPDPEASARRRRRVLGGLLVVVLLGAGGFVMYRRHLASVERDQAIAEQLAIAQASYTATDPRHWQRAAAAARRVVDLDDSNAAALGIGAEGLLASALDDGIGASIRIGQAHAMLDSATRHKIKRPEITRARALAALAARQPDAAIAQLQPLVTQAPGDPTLALYLGWALTARGDAAAAEAAYDRAATAPAVKLAALYGRGNARLALGKLEAAKADFNAVLALSKDHIGAQVGLAAALPLSAAQQRETDLLTILARKDIAGADPRAVAQAWTVAGDAAMRAGRYDVARERFRKALAVPPADLAATAGLAETELRDGKLPAAAELTARALNAAKDHVAAQLVQSEIEIKQRRFSLATQRLTALGNRATPLTPLERARLQLVMGRLLEAEGKDDEAADAYVAGAKAARELDLEPMLAAVGKLAAMTKVAMAERDAPRAAALRSRADELLGGFTDQARRDPQLALTLGIGYLQAGNADKAEPLLRHAAEARPLDAEARFQHGRALLKSGRPQDALEALDAAVRLDPGRADIAADLAHTFEVLGRDADAGTIYGRLLDRDEPSIELRARGGRFFARTGAIDRAAEQGKKILAIDPRHPAGLYLKGEGLLAADRPLEAKQLFQRAIEVERDPQYLDALGRAAEAMGRTGDREAQELALRSYQAAAEADSHLLNPLIGLGRLHVARREPAKAVPPLLAASRINPKNADVMLLLGAAYQEIEQPAMARQMLEDANRITPRAEAYWRLGQIERDTNHGARAAVALVSATRMAAEIEKRTGKPVPWLTDALYLQGRVSLDLRNEPAAREAWQQYVGRNPPPSAQLNEVKQMLSTSLR